MTPTQEEIEPFVRALLTSDRHAALGIARLTLQQWGPGVLFDDVVPRSMRRVGDLWSENRITVADEHMATALAQSIVTILYGEIEWPPVGPVALITCTEREHHWFGAQIVADLLSLDGWDARDLGGAVPTDAVVAMAKSVHPVFVAISTTLLGHLPQTRALIAALRAADPKLHTIVGGRAVDLLDDHGRSVGADATASSARAAVLAVRAWKP